MDLVKGAASCKLGDDSDEDYYDISGISYDIDPVDDTVEAASAPPCFLTQIYPYHVKFLHTPFFKIDSLSDVACCKLNADSGVAYYSTSRILPFNDLESVDETAEAASPPPELSTQIYPEYVKLSHSPSVKKEDAVCCKSDDDSDEDYYGTLQTQVSYDMPCHLLSTPNATPLDSPTQIYAKKVKFYYYGISHELPDPYVDPVPICYIDMSSAQASPKKVELQHDAGSYKAPDASSDTASHYNAIDSEKTQALYLTMMDAIASRNNAGSRLQTAPAPPSPPAPQSPRRNSRDPEGETQLSGCFNFRLIV